jgi:hypothetical protein
MAKTGFYQTNPVVEETESSLTETTSSLISNDNKAKSSFYAQNNEYEDIESASSVLEDAEAAQEAAETAQAGAEAAQAAAESAQAAAELAETNAETAETNAELAETNAETAQAAAEAAQAAAETAETNAETAETNAETAETNAELAQSYAEEWANKAEDSLVSAAAGGDEIDDYSALHWANKASDSAVAAALAETNAETAETNAETAETNAETAQAAAEAARDAAITAKNAAELAETNAETAETNAETAETNAETAEANAETAQAAAEDAQSYAEEWANKAEDSLISVAAGGDNVDDYSALHWANKANDSAVAAAASETAAELAETNAELAETNAEAAQAAAEAAYDAFDDRYLGSKAADPTLDNDGNALLTGALYWNSVASNLRVYNGASWSIYSATGLSAVADDTSPQLGGDLDTNTFNISFDDGDGITDDSGNEQLMFQKTASAVNYFEITNAATAGRPTLSVTGPDADVALELGIKTTPTALGSYPYGAHMRMNMGDSYYPNFELYSQPDSAHFAGQGGGMTFSAYMDMATPEDTIWPFSFVARANNDNNESVGFAEQWAKVVDITEDAEIGSWEWYLRGDGAIPLTMQLMGGASGGLILGSPTGSFKGISTINTAGAIYVNNVLVPLPAAATTWTGIQTFSGGTPDPTNGNDTFAIRTTGSYGGGIGLTDGTFDGAIWCTTSGDDHIIIGSGTSGGSLTEHLGVGPTGLTLGSPTGGFKGANTLNAAGNMYVNDSLVLTAATANVAFLDAYAAFEDGVESLGGFCSISQFGMTDDTAVNFTIGGHFHCALVLISGNTVSGSVPNGMWAVRCGSSSNQVTAVAKASGSNVVETTGVHTGTTGTDTKFTIAAGNNGICYLENRTGGNQTLYVTIINRP